MMNIEPPPDVAPPREIRLEPPLQRESPENGVVLKTAGPRHFPELDDARAATHFSISVWMKSANSLGVPPTGSVPCALARCGLHRYPTQHWQRPTASPMVAGGVPVGASSPIQIPAS